MSERRQKRAPRPRLQGDMRQAREKPVEPWRQVCRPLPVPAPKLGTRGRRPCKTKHHRFAVFISIQLPPHRPPLIVPLVSMRSWFIYRILKMLILTVFLKFSLLLRRDKLRCFFRCRLCRLPPLIWFRSQAGNDFLRQKTGNNEMTAFLQSLNNLQRFEGEFGKILEA